MLINDPTALFMIPFGKELSWNAWELISGLKLMFIPLIAIVMRETFDARAQGADEGSAAVLAYKRVEFLFIGWLAVALLFVIPMGGTETYKYTQYSCSATQANDTKVESIVQMAPRGGLMMNGEMLGRASSPLLTGAIHDFSTTLGSAMTAAIPCEQGTTIADVHSVTEKLIPADLDVKLARPFVEQCYLHGKSRLEEAQKNVNDVLYVPKDSMTGLEKRSMFNYNSPSMVSAYKGIHDIEQSLPPLRMDWGVEHLVPDRNMKCDEAVEFLEKRLGNTIDRRFDDVAGTRTDTTALDVKKETLAYFNYYAEMSMDQLDDDYQQLVLTRAYEQATGRVDIDDFGHGSVTNAFHKEAEVIKNAISSSADSKEVGGIDSISRIIMAVPQALTEVDKSVAAYAATLYIPMINASMQGFLLAVMPIVIVASGMKMDTCVKMHLAYFGLCLVPFFLNIGLFMGTLISSSSMNNITDYDAGVHSSVMRTVASMMVIVAPTIWMVIVQGMGGMAVSSVQAAGDAANKIGQRASQMIGSFNQKQIQEKLKKLK